MNSTVAPSSAADFFASATRCLGVPEVPASPREQMTKCAARPARVSRAITPPQPNSMSSGCAPKASSSASLVFDFSVGFIGSVNDITADKSDFRRVFPAKIGLFARPGNVMRAAHHRLHPTQSRVTRGTDLLFGETSHRQSHEGIAALVQLQCAVSKSGANNFTIVRNVHEKLRHVAGGFAKSRIARTRHANAIKQSHAALHLQTKVSDGGGVHSFEKINQGMFNIVRQLKFGLVLPTGGNALEMKRGKLPLGFVCECKIEQRRFVGFAMAQDGLCFARIVIAVVTEENDFAADFFLQPPRGLDFCNEEAARKKSAWLLSETNDR